MTARASYIIGDVRDVMATLEDGSVDLVMTSPPFLALRSYLPAGHPDKHREIGAEPDPAGFLSTLLGLTAEWRRVLAPHGSICVELGDTYSGSGGAGGDYLDGGPREGQQVFGGSAKASRESNAAHWRAKNRRDAEWPMAKSLCGIPHLYHLSLAYGRNMLTGEPCEPWRVRNVVAWCRPNPPVGALGDKFRPATSYMTIATVAKDRYFDLDAVRTRPKGGREPGEPVGSGAYSGHPDEREGRTKPDRVSNAAGAPPLDWWEIPTAPYSGSHYAVYPPALCEKPIETMVPRRVCVVCGEPSRRIVETEQVDTGRTTNGPKNIGRKNETASGYATRTISASTTVGWTDCGHGQWRPGVVLDPFAGSGTTLMVATGRARAAIGIDIDHRNADLATDRVGPLLLDAYTLDEWKNREHVA